MKFLSPFLATLISFCFVIPASAQLEFGAIAGLNFSNISMDPEDRDLSTRTGFGIGGIVKKNLSENLDLIVEPMYLEKGAKENSGGVDVSIKLANLEIPVLVKYAFGTGEIRPYVIGGPTIGFNLSAKVSGSEGGFSIDEDLKDEIKSVDFGIVVGAGASKPVGNHSVFGEVRYSAGLTNINDDPDSEDSSLKNNGVQVLFGIIFGKGAN